MMVGIGETIRTGAAERCRACEVMLVEEVHMSPAGYYIGTWCNCGPYSRESDYYPDRESAQKALDSWSVSYRDNPETV
jgi:hypothetical protein